jgi:AraC-like DNA-binding protein
MTRGLLRSQLVAPAMAMVREAGGDVEALLRRFELPPSAETSADVLLPVKALQGLLDAAAEASGEPNLGLRIASRYRRGMFGLLEFAWRAAATVRDGCERIARHVPLISDLLEITFAEHDHGGTIEERIAGEPLCVGRQANEFFVSALVLQTREITGVPIVPDRVYLAHPRPDDVQELVDVFGTSALEFDRGANGLVVGPAVLALPLQTSDPPLLAIIEKQAEAALATVPARGRLLGHVRDHVRRNLAGAPPSLASVAQALRSSPRSLQRGLQEEGATFQQVIDSVREDLALALVAEGEPVGSVAHALGYSEESAFLRAFRRWTGTTPAVYRRTRGLPSTPARPPSSRP